jgi:adenylate cyclase
MQQLNLFGNERSNPIRRKSRSAGKGAARGCGWDLWTQEADAERELVLFFLDIRNFTPLTEKHRASDVIHIVRKLFSTFQKIIRIYHGRIIETSGDGFYAAFGFDQCITEAVNSAVNAGTTILQTLENLNARSFEKNLQQRIDVGIGVHVGKVATGNLHIGSKDHFVVMGYPVNVASRLQAATKELNNNFIVSSSAYRLLPTFVNEREPVTLNLKGVVEPCEVHLVGNSYAA